MGFNGLAQSTPYAAQVRCEGRRQEAQDHGMRTLEVEVAAPAPARVGVAFAAVGASHTLRFATSRRSRTTAAVQKKASSMMTIFSSGGPAEASAAATFPHGRSGMRHEGRPLNAMGANVTIQKNCRN